MIHGLQQNGLLATAKHFPGHGNTASDSHSHLPVINSDLDQLEELELIPFKSAIDNKVALVMTGHIAVPKLTDDQIIPATRSKELIRDLLRDDLDFKGIVVSDAMNMSSISPRGVSAESLIESFNAGVDLLLMPLNLHLAVNTLIEAVHSKQISIDRLDESVERILTAKHKIGLFENRQTDISILKEKLESEQFSKLSTEIAQKSITILRRSDVNLPFESDKQILTICVSSEPSFENLDNYSHLD